MLTSNLAIARREATRFVGRISRRRNPTWVHHRRKAPLLFDLLVLRIVGTNVGLRYAYPTYKTDTTALSLRQDFSFTLDCTLRHG
ncbi:MAG: hypothetical protein LBB76_11150 [Azoarcus sp.]|jgi:hypothetical protein|nr:hypothetical protein [Azoarcus sp.]